MSKVKDDSFFLWFQLAEELLYQGWREEVQELVALVSKPHFKVKSFMYVKSKTPQDSTKLHILCPVTFLAQDYS